jgi:hypothetical protein
MLIQPEEPEEFCGGLFVGVFNALWMSLIFWALIIGAIFCFNIAGKPETVGESVGDKQGTDRPAQYERKVQQ